MIPPRGMLLILALALPGAATAHHRHGEQQQGQHPGEHDQGDHHHGAHHQGAHHHGAHQHGDQHHAARHGGGHQHGPHQAPAQPYAGMHDRAIKALSAEETADLRAGRGMGLALAAELNGYPGPMHVLELADRLDLTPEQRDRMEALLAAMRAEVRPLGEAVISAEAALDRLFAGGQAEAAGVTAATEAAGAARAALRAAHLRAHLAAREVLSPEQQRRYAGLRGYRPG